MKDRALARRVFHGRDRMMGVGRGMPYWWISCSWAACRKRMAPNWSGSLKPSGGRAEALLDFVAVGREALIGLVQSVNDTRAF